MTEEKKKKERLVYLDIVRIFACLCILIIHFNASVCGYDTTAKFVYHHELIPNHYFGVYLGSIGVGLFFLLSGICLQLVYGEVSLKIKNLFNFYKKRAISLYPTYWVVFTIFTLFSFAYSKVFPKFHFLHFLTSLVGLDGYLMNIREVIYPNYQCGEWFLGCIILLYLIYPLISFCFNRFPKTTSILTACAYFYLVTIFKFHTFFLQIPYFILGMMFTKYFKTAKSWKLWIPTIPVVVLAFIFHNNITDHTKTLVMCWTLFLLITLSVEIFNKYSDYLKKEEVAKKISYIGVLTYPLFLVHHKVCSLLTSRFDLSYFPYSYTVLLFIIYMIITIVLSVYFLKLTNKLTKHN